MIGNAVRVMCMATGKKPDDDVSEKLSGLRPELPWREQGHRNPTVVTLYELAQVLGVISIDLLRDEPDRSLGREAKRR